MRFLPIVERELRVASRRRTTYWLRPFIALVTIIVGAGIILSCLDNPPREVAQYLFYTLPGIALLYCLLSGLRSTADCISEEKREGTLGLLFLTDLKGYDVVLGKLVANSLTAFYGLLAILPVMSVPLLMGSLTGTQVARVLLVLVNTMFFSMALGIFASASSRSAAKSLGFTLFLILLFTAGIPALGMTLAWKYHWKVMEEMFFVTSPVFSYAAAQNNAMGTRWPDAFYWSLGIVHALGWAFLLLACVIAPRAWQDRPAGVARLRWRERMRLWSFGDARQRHAFRTRLLDQNAFFWLAARSRLKPAMVWSFLGCVACAWAWGLAKFYRDWMNEVTFIATALVLNWVLKNWIASESARQIGEERRMGSLELLLSTPLSVPEIVHGQALALRRQFMGPVALTLLVELAMLLTGLTEDFGRTDWPGRICLWLAYMIMLPADIIALFWVGMWLGLASKNPKRAYSDTVGRVLALPWVGWALFMTLMALVTMRGRFEPGWKFILGMWFILGIATNIGFGMWARNKVLTEFRTVATQRFEVRPSLLRRLLGLGSGENRRE